MNKKLIIILIIIAVICITILGLLIGLKIEYYDRIPFEITDGNVVVILDEQPKTIFINVNNNVYEVNKWVWLNNKTYILDFTINKDIYDKVFCYISTYKLNYLSYIFKIVFNI